jgi:hypothetical protein
VIIAVMKHQSKVESSSLRRKIQSYFLFAFQAPLVCILTLLLEEVKKKMAPATCYDQVSYCSSGNRADHLHHTGIEIGSPAWLRPKNLCLTDKRDASFTTGEFEIGRQVGFSPTFPE